MKALVTGRTGAIGSYLRTIAREILPPFITKAIQRRNGSELTSTYWGRRSYPEPEGRNIVAEARRHFERAARGSPGDAMPQSDRWIIYTDRMHDSINKLTTPRNVIFHAQSQMGFDHRSPATNWQPYLKHYIFTLKGEFPHFPNLIDESSDSPYSRPETLLKYRGRLVSNVLFWHLRELMQCLTYVKEPKIVGEIGGGYGGLARLWLQNTALSSGCYVDIDIPESLFYAEVFLRANFDNLKLLYVTDSKKLAPEVASQYSVILCPAQFVDAISGLSLDLVINTGSLQEMTEEWVDFWMQWLKGQDCRWFYSFNQFAQPLDFMMEGKNTWSPRLTPEWTVRRQTFNPAFAGLQSTRNLAEILAQKQSTPPLIDKKMLSVRYKLTEERVLDGQTLLEAMDAIRLYPDEDTMWKLLTRCVAEMRQIPKEACYLAERLNRHASQAFQAHHGTQLQALLQQLSLLRSSEQADLKLL